MANEIIVLTGATDGLGRAAARRFAARKNTRLILLGRSAEKLADVAHELAGLPAQVNTVVADFAELAQVRQAAAAIARLTDRVTLLVNNAGIGGGAAREESVDGYELVLAVNHLAPFLLTDELLALLDRGAPSRVVNVASIGQEPVDADALEFAEGYTPHSAYTRSKFVMVSTGFARARALDAARVTVNSIHPATLMPTKMVRAAGAPVRDTLESGVEALFWVATDPSLNGVSGEFFNGTTAVRASDEAYDEQLQHRLFLASVALTAPTVPSR